MDMTWTEQLLDAVENSGAEPGKKAVAKEFLQAAGPIVEALGPSVFDELMRAAAGGNVPAAIAETLNASQVAALVAQMEVQLGAMVEQHAAEKEAWKSAMAGLEQAALGAVARVVIAVL
jgi:hypothetical protein